MGTPLTTSRRPPLGPVGSASPGAAFAYLTSLHSFKPPIDDRVPSLDPRRAAEDRPGSSNRPCETVVAPAIVIFEMT